LAFGTWICEIKVDVNFEWIRREITPAQNGRQCPLAREFSTG
jgi:hypothetical protein